MFAIRWRGCAQGKSSLFQQVRKEATAPISSLYASLDKVDCERKMEEKKTAAVSSILKKVHDAAHFWNNSHFRRKYGPVYYSIPTFGWRRKFNRGAYGRWGTFHRHQRRKVGIYAD